MSSSEPSSKQEKFSILKIFAFLSLLSRAEKVKIGVISGVRASLALFDLAGLILIGAVASLLSGVQVSDDSPTGFLSNLAKDLGFQEPSIFLAVLGVSFFVIRGGLAVYLTYFTARIISRIEADKAVDLFSNSRLIRFDQSSGLSPERLTQYLTQNLPIVLSGGVGVVTTFIAEGALLIAIGTFLILSSPSLAVLIFGWFGILAVFMTWLLGSFSVRIANRNLRASIESLEPINELISNFRQAALTRGPLRLVSRFRDARYVAAETNAQYLAITQMPRHLFEIVLMTGISLMLVASSFLDFVRLEPSVLAVFAVGMLRISGSFIPIQNGFNQLRQVQVFSDPIFKLTSAIAQSQGTSNPVRSELVGQKPNLEFQGVELRFADSTESLFSNLSFTLPFGSILAITGPSGVGKSTLSDLLTGFRAPRKGRVVIGGITNPTALQLRGVVSYSPQDVSLITGTLVENIWLEDRLDAPGGEEIEEIMQKAGLITLAKNPRISELSNLRDGMTNISGGQLQRIGLARALVGEPKILVLDEFTSSLDAGTEEELLQSLFRLKGAMTVVLVTHREAPLRFATHHLELDIGSYSFYERSAK